MDLQTFDAAVHPGGRSAGLPDELHPAGQIHTVVLETPHALLEHLEAWQDLATNAVEPNPFFEPWLLLPALNEFGAGETFRFVLVYRRDSLSKTPGQLCAFFPFAVRRQYDGLHAGSIPVRTLFLWRHKYCYVGTPLVRRGLDSHVLDPLFDWIERGTDRCSLVEFQWLPEGAFHRLLVQRFHRLGTFHFIAQRSTRAAIHRVESAESYLRCVLAGKVRRETGRCERLLQSAGSVRFRQHLPGENPEAMIEEFIDLETKSWKGTEGFHLASCEREVSFFRAAAREGLRTGGMQLSGLYLDGVPIAMKCNVRAREASFAFKICYDPAFAKYGPGVQLEVDYIRRLHDPLQPVQWVDSCASPNNPMCKRLYNDLRVIQDLVIGCGVKGQLLVSSLPLARFVNRAFRRRDRMTRAGP